MGTITMIMAAIEAASRLAAAGADIARRLNAGELTDEQAAAEWERTREAYKAGADAWDRAGR